MSFCVDDLLVCIAEGPLHRMNIPDVVLIQLILLMMDT